VELTVRPIGYARSPFVEKAQAPRQGVTPEGAAGTIEVLPEHEHALSDLEGFERLWILFWFDRNEGARNVSKVLPPRSDVKRGVFATRSPHRPNPIGMTAVRLVKVDGLVVHVDGLDLLDRTPVLDLKPYIPYADAFPDAREGWLDAPPDPRPAWTVRLSPLAAEQIAWAEAHGAEGLRARVEQALALGPQPHPYRRIKKTEDGALVLAVKDWRVRFAPAAGAGPAATAEDRALVVERLDTGYRPRDLAGRDRDPAHELHRAFVAKYRLAP
jgi:tRNA-Thr(GGU) m(6)t(6)A37 methyltransferase TsaA